MSAKANFAKFPEFLAAFDNIEANGFFEKFNVSLGEEFSEGNIRHCFIDISGCIPAKKKYYKKGCGTLFDPRAFVQSCRLFAGHEGIKKVNVDIATTDWELFDAHEHVIGSKGSRVRMKLSVEFKI